MSSTKKLIIFANMHSKCWKKVLPINDIRCRERFQVLEQRTKNLMPYARKLQPPLELVQEAKG